MKRFSIKTESGIPVYLQMAEQIKKAISVGILKPGDKMTTVRELAIQLCVNPNTAAKAYRYLEGANLLKAEIGRGTFVSLNAFKEVRRQSIEDLIENFLSESTALGYSAEDILERINKVIEAGELTNGKRD